MCGPGGEVVTLRTANPPCAGSIPAQASNERSECRGLENSACALFVRGSNGGACRTQRSEYDASRDLRFLARHELRNRGSIPAQASNERSECRGLEKANCFAFVREAKSFAMFVSESFIREQTAKVYCSGTERYPAQASNERSECRGLEKSFIINRL